MICPACGAENREGARYCRRCRFELGAAPAVDASVAASPVQETTPVAAGEPAPAQAGPGEAEPEAEAPAGALPAEPELGEPEAGPEREQTAEQPEVEAEEPLEEASAGEGAAGAAPDQAEGEGETPPGPEEDVLVFWREESQPLQPTEPGTVVAGRYRLLEALDVQPAQILYEAEDTRACWQCGFEGNAPQDAFCAQCGAALQKRPQVRLLQVGQSASRPSVPPGAELSEPLEHEGQVYFLVSEPPAASEPPGRDLRLVAGHRSDTGRVRELDEDSLLVITVAPSYEARTAPVLGLFAVADGMGGHEGGEVASKLALQVLSEHVLRGIVLPELAGQTAPDEGLLARLQAGVTAANDAVYLARQKRGNDMGTTLTAVLVRDARLCLAHVGDCRAYRWNAEGLEQLTTDHSVVASMIANGQAAPDEIYSHPHRSIIYRSIGDKPAVEVDGRVLPLAAGDRLIVCSDGLWEMVRNEGIADVMLQEADPQAACDLLVKHANLAGGEDNISIVIVAVAAL